MQQLKFIDRSKPGGKGSCCDSLASPAQSVCCASPANERPAFATGTIMTPAGAVFRVSSDWSRTDTWGMIRSRTSAFRMRYSVSPGLYAVGDPSQESDVFVTANYKLSFDLLRRELKGLNAWILVLDTKSINVWCAAGKGTFGTEELIGRIAATSLDKVVAHRRIILPQLGAVGVKASDIQKKTGFLVQFGPVQARDITAYVRTGYKKTARMSTISFPILDRMVLTPMEINPSLKKFFPWFAFAVLLIFGLQPSGILFRTAWNGGWPFLALGLVSVFAGAFMTPVFLPLIPFRSFALKGWIMGMLFVAATLPFLGNTVRSETPLLIAAWLFFPAVSSYIALQFTGSTTFTGITGVKKELKIGIPIYLGTVAVSLVLIALFKLKQWGLI